MSARILESAAALLPDAAPAGTGAPAFMPGDLGHLVVRASWEGDATLRFPTREELEAAMEGKLHVLDDGGPAPADAAALHASGNAPQDARTWRVQVLLAPGEHEVAAIPLVLQDAAGTKLESADVPGPTVTVGTTLAAEEAVGLDEAQADPQALRAAVAERLAPARGPWELAPRIPWWAFILVGLALLALLFMLARRWWRRRAQRPVPSVPLEPAEVVARRRLRELREGALLTTGRSLDFHVAVADIVKQYLERRLGADLREMTTDEIRRLFHGSMKTATNVPQVRQETLAVLSACDLVKFARVVPVPSEALALLDAAERIITKSTEAAPAPPGDASGPGPGPGAPAGQPGSPAPSGREAA